MTIAAAALATTLYVAALSALGAAWRRGKGDALPAWVATVGLPVLCLLLVAPHAPHFGWGALAAALPLWGLLGVFFLVEANNGGNGHPLRRFGPFGLGYWWAARHAETIREFRLLGITWIKPRSYSDVGEAFLGGSTFGFLAACSAAAVLWSWGSH